MNSFQPERRGQLGGTLTAQAEFRGKGVTYPNLKKNFNGRFDLGSTNLDLAIRSVRSPLLKTIVNVIAIVPSLLKNRDSGAALSSLAGALLGGGSSAEGGGWTDDLAKSPEELRKFGYELAVNFMAWEITTFLLGEYGTHDIATNPLFSIVDALVLVSQRDGLSLSHLPQ